MTRQVAAAAGPIVAVFSPKSNTLLFTAWRGRRIVAQFTLDGDRHANSDMLHVLDAFTTHNRSQPPPAGQGGEDELER